MGDHYIPQYYLRGFSTVLPPFRTTRYEKGTNKVITTSLKNVGQETDFYSPEHEKYLANEIEAPANLVLDKIRGRGTITPDEKANLAAYMVTMLKRVPRSIQRMQAQAPKVAESVANSFFEQLERYRAQHPDKSNIVDERTRLANELFESYKTHVPKDMWLNALSPDQTPAILTALNSMTWQFLVWNSREGLITNDNPVFFFESMGIGKEKSEVTFPISSHIALWATWRADLQEGYVLSTQAARRIINLRTASAATRYLFYSCEERWVMNLALKKKFGLGLLT